MISGMQGYSLGGVLFTYNSMVEKCNIKSIALLPHLVQTGHGYTFTPLRPYKKIGVGEYGERFEMR
jgi:hypothetical protein